MPADLLTSRYVPKETLLVRKSDIPPDQKYKVEEASQYYGKSTISEEEAIAFALKIATGEIKYSVSKELGLVKIQ